MGKLFNIHVVIFFFLIYDFAYSASRLSSRAWPKPVMAQAICSFKSWLYTLWLCVLSVVILVTLAIEPIVPITLEHRASVKSGLPQFSQGSLGARLSTSPNGRMNSWMGCRVTDCLGIEVGIGRVSRTRLR